MTDTRHLVHALTLHKRQGTPFDTAWSRVAGRVPPKRDPEGGVSLAWFEYTALRDSYNDVGPVVRLCPLEERDAA